jgi:hypothetical protein
MWLANWASVDDWDGLEDGVLYDSVTDLANPTGMVLTSLDKVEEIKRMAVRQWITDYEAIDLPDRAEELENMEWHAEHDGAIYQEWHAKTPDKKIFGVLVIREAIAL